MLLANGHSDAGFYPIGAVYDEARIVIHRINGDFVTQAILVQHAMVSVLSKEGGKAFSKLAAALTEE